LQADLTANRQAWTAKQVEVQRALEGVRSGIDPDLIRGSTAAHTSGLHGTVDALNPATGGDVTGMALGLQWLIGSGP
jgi:hypothetical protein